MWTLGVINAIRLIESREDWTREKILAHQRDRFRELLTAVWQRSPFYREFYLAHGIREAELPDITVTDLPIINKEVLMEHFDRISEDPLLRRDKIEAWVHSDAPLKRYSKKYVVVHTSGTGGTMGIFVYDRIGWTRFRGVYAVRSKMKFRNNPLRRNRLAFYGAAHGRFTGVTSTVTAPAMTTRKLVCSVLDPIDRIVEQLNSFQPELLTGYPSAIKDLAMKAMAGELTIRPHYVLTAGEVLTNSNAELIEKGFGQQPVNAYAASEAICIALQRRVGPGLSLMEDENVVEILDEQDQSVAAGRSGRVVLTNLSNLAIPIIRYDMRDMVTRGHREDGERFEPILGVDGRVNDALPIRSANGAVDSIHPVVLSEFFVPGIQKFQFVGRSPEEVSIRYMASRSVDDEVRRAFRKILDLKNAAPSVCVGITRVEALPVDEKTGKFRLVVLNGST